MSKATTIQRMRRGGPAKEAPTLAEIEARTTLDPISGCWLWLGSADQHGYGLIRRKSIGGLRRVSALVCEITQATSARGFFVMHSCDTPRCVNPAHLKLGNQAENMADAAKRGRSASGDRSGARRHPERLVRGESHPFAKLTNESVEELRRSAGAVSHRVLAERFGVSQATVSRVIARKQWVPDLSERDPKHFEIARKRLEALKYTAISRSLFEATSGEQMALGGEK